MSKITYYNSRAAKEIESHVMLGMSNIPRISSTPKTQLTKENLERSIKLINNSSSSFAQEAHKFGVARTSFIEACVRHGLYERKARELRDRHSKPHSRNGK